MKFLLLVTNSRTVLGHISHRYRFTLYFLHKICDKPGHKSPKRKPEFGDSHGMKISYISTASVILKYPKSSLGVKNAIHGLKTLNNDSYT